MTSIPQMLSEGIDVAMRVETNEHAPRVPENSIVRLSASLAPRDGDICFYGCPVVEIIYQNTV